MRILITGVAGLIGNELAHQLSALDHELIGCDDLSHECVDIMSLPVKQNLLCSVEQLPLFEASLRPLDLIIHCASPIGHAMLTPAAEIAWKIVSGTQAMLDLASRTEARLITFSSSEVLSYRGETDIRAQYSLGKLTSEAMALGHPKVDAKVIRPYNVTGRLQRADGGFVMARFRDAALRGEPLTVFGSGEQKRCFLHVSDFARFVCLLAEWWPERERWGVFNPGNVTTMKDLASLFATRYIERWQRINVDGATTLNNPDWRDTPERPLDMGDYIACNQLGWVPRVGLEEIVHEHLTSSPEYLKMLVRTKVAND